MKLNQKKLQKQLALIRAWKQNRYRGTVCAVTGFGKSYIGHLIIKQMVEKYPTAETLIVVPTLKLKEQWEENILRDQLPYVTVSVINSAIKVDWDVNLLILDEIHRYASEIFVQIFDRTKFQYILGLTATMERKDKKHYILEEYAPIIGTVDMTEALENEYISNFSIFNVGLEMTFSDQARYKRLHDNFIKYFKLFDFDFSKAMQALKSESYRKSFAKASGNDEKAIHISAIQFSRAMQNRKKFLYNNETKKEIARQVIQKFPVNTITFAETTAFADELTEHIGTDISFSYHSKLSKKKKEEFLKRFQDPADPLRVVNTARALDEGFDMESLEMAIICAGSSTQRQYIQRIGRTVRVSEDKTALILNLYLKGTQDENWLRGRGVMPNSIFINDINEINYNEYTKHYTKSADLPQFTLIERNSEEE